MKKATKTKVISIYADDKKGLLGQILMIFNRSNYPVHQVSAARTDIEGIVMITLEVSLPDEMLSLVMLKIEKILEVYQTKGYSGFDAELLQAGHYLIAKDFADSALFAVLQRHGANVAGVTTAGFVIQKTGTTSDLEAFYRLLDGPGLLSYCKSGLIVAHSMMPFEELNTRQ